MILNIAPPRSGELCFLNKKGFRRHTLFAITIGLILITNKTADKKSSHNPYMQDYVRFFVQFLIGS